MVSWVRGKCIGKGSFGTVNVAVKKGNGAVFAVKSVDRNACVFAQIESLENEIRILRSLKTSPYVVKYLGDDDEEEEEFCESSTTSYRNLHLEYLPGGTVADMATSTSVYVDDDESVLRSHVYCIVSAIRQIHSNGVVHCDVKGRNVLVSQNPSFCKLADFGSAREVSSSVDDDGTCRAKSVVVPRGSPLWMAPEVVRGEFQGPESDVWSLGCTVVEMVTGKPAWEGSGADTLSRIGFSDELPKFPSRLTELGRDFLEKCLRRDPSRRWSCDQLLQHPFLLSASPPPTSTESSPRCVLDWVNSDFEFEEEEEGDIHFERLEESAKIRIGKLAGSSGADWESDGWVAVRDFYYYSNSTRIELEETAGTSSVYSDSTRVKEEFENIGGGDKTIFEEADMINMDMGCHTDGFIAVVAHTHVVQDGPVKGRAADVIAAANTSAGSCFEACQAWKELGRTKT
ncbi:hypothetical protein Ddye_025313 [Dipteronia dyeriana]|uniref:Protein kinase domain-containing protein n=1 Tax=Dipteronia dyeriana TaxID=168575 RepID=A0AAD9TWI4_9ROSI|nr:hypothetical protein Ddye_025313 [Dipteronia dyeriana]